MVQLTDNIWAIPVHDDAKDFDFDIHPEEEWYQFTWDTMIDDEDSGFYGELEQHSVDIPLGVWQFLFTTKEATEEQARQVVRSSEWYFPEQHIRYVDYAHPYGIDNKQKWSIWFATAKESLQSLLTSKGLNPDLNYAIIKNTNHGQ